MPTDAPGRRLAPGWQSAPIPPDEIERLAALRRLNVLDTAPTEALDTVTRLAAAALRVPILIVSLVDRDRQWFMSKVGLDAEQTSRDESFCAHAVSARRPMVVQDATRDARFAGNPLVLNAPHIRSYMGVPLFTRGGQPVGTLCAIDMHSRAFGDKDLEMLQGFAGIVENFLHARELALHTDMVIDYAMNRERLFRETFEQAAVGMGHLSPAGALLRTNQRMCDMLGYTNQELCGMCIEDVVHAEHLADSRREFQKMLAGETDGYRLESRLRRKGGGVLWAILSVALKSAQSGKPDYAMLVIEDISHAKELEEELLRANDRGGDAAP